MRGGALGFERAQLHVGLVEQPQLAIGLELAVADVVDSPREGVRRAHRTPALARQQADPIVEVGRLRARDRLAATIGLAGGDAGALRALLERRRGAAHELLGIAPSAVRARTLLPQDRDQRAQSAPAPGTRRPGENFVARALDRIERRAPAGEEGGDGQALATVQLAHERGPVVEQRSRSRDLESEHRAQRLARSCAARTSAGIEFGECAAEARHVLGRQVYAAGCVVLGDVLAVLSHLQCRADRVRQRDPRRGGPPEDAEHELADGVGGQRAVGAQLLPAFVPRVSLVGPIGRDQAQERLARQ